MTRPAGEGHGGRQTVTIPRVITQVQGVSVGQWAERRSGSDTAAGTFPKVMASMGTTKKSLLRLAGCILVTCLLVTGAACTSGSTSGSGSGGQTGTNTGGAQATGGTTTSGTGGTTATGGAGSGGATGSGGTVATGGTSSAGGSVATGGSSATGGTSTTSSGGTSSGGTPATGGIVGTGGTRSTGGVQGTGGASSSGGGTGTGTGGGASTGGRSGTGGTIAAGGTSGGATGGMPGTGGQPGTGGGSGGGTGQACASTLPAITDYTALAGPFATTTENNTGPDGKSVIYRPKTLGENGFLHAPIVFGPGIGMQASQLSGLLLSFASHGYVVVGTAVLNGGPNDPANKATMQNALTWIIQQNDKAGTYQGKLATKCAISMGYSVGGTAAVEIGGDPAVATTVSIHGHVATSAMHGPLLQTSGDLDTVGRPMQQQTFDKSQVQTFFGTVSGADHGYIQSNNGGAERPAIIAWMRYWINGDQGAKKYFWGDTCVCCVSPWMDPKRKNWQ
jgi:dienelactone hydrolase